MKVQHRTGILSLFLGLACLQIYVYTEDVGWLPVFTLAFILGAFLLLADHE